MNILRGTILGTLVVTAVALSAPSAAVGVASPSASSHPARVVLPPQVKHTGTAPTGYTVTFRYSDPSARRVQIKGEWWFGNPYQLPKLAGTSTTDVIPTPGRLPSQWQPGDVPLHWPVTSTGAHWPVMDMTQIGHSGVWIYTTPLPSGVFNYGFFVNCTDPTQSTCTEAADPNNLPWNVHGSVVEGSIEERSQVYVPSDPKFRTQDLSWQAPNSRHGSLADITYPAPTSLRPAGHNFLSVYTPPGYDPNRAQPYPTLYMLAPDDEVAWTTLGDLNNILDNLIDDGEIQPVVLVSANLNGFPESDDSSAADANLIDSVIPFIEAHYNVSRAASQRAIGAMGNAASVVNSLLFNHTAKFRYFGAFGFSEGEPFTLPAAATLTADQIAALKSVSVLIGGGYEDPHHWYHASEVALLTSVGVPVFPDFVLGDHTWTSWRINAKDFITRVAFFPPPAG